MRNSLFQYVWNPLSRYKSVDNSVILRCYVFFPLYFFWSCDLFGNGKRNRNAVFCNLQMYPISWQTLFLSTTLQINHEIRHVSHSDIGLQVSMAGLARIFWVISPCIMLVWFRHFEKRATSIFMVTELPSGGYLNLIQPPWRWDYIQANILTNYHWRWTQYVFPKRCNQTMILHGVITQETHDLYSTDGSVWNDLCSCLAL